MYRSREEVTYTASGVLSITTTSKWIWIGVFIINIILLVIGLSIVGAITYHLLNFFTFPPESLMDWLALMEIGLFTYGVYEFLVKSPDGD